MSDSSPDLQLYIGAILARFSPATEDEATHFFSTEEVRDAIKLQNPQIEGLTNVVVHSALSEAGFNIGLQKGTQSMRFVWLMKEK